MFGKQKIAWMGQFILIMNKKKKSRSFPGLSNFLKHKFKLKLTSLRLH